MLTVYLDTGSGKHREIVNIQLSDLVESLGEDCRVTFLGYCVFTGGDCTSFFKGKMGPPQIIQPNRWRLEYQGSYDETAGAVYIILNGYISKSSVNGIHVKLLHKMVRDDKELISKLAIGKQMASLIMKNTMKIEFDSFDESDEWWVNGWTGPFRIVLPVIIVMLQTQYAPACIVHIMDISY